VKPGGLPVLRICRHGFSVGTRPVHVPGRTVPPGTGRTGPVPTGFANPGHVIFCNVRISFEGQTRPIMVPSLIFWLEGWVRCVYSMSYEYMCVKKRMCGAHRSILVHASNSSKDHVQEMSLSSDWPCCTESTNLLHS
jgi:hypothetical protein